MPLPLSRPARDRNATVFLNLENLEPHQDQWSYLSTVGRMTPKEVSRAADKAGRVPAGSEVTRLAAPASTKIRPEAAAVVRARLEAGIRAGLLRIRLRRKGSHAVRGLECTCCPGCCCAAKAQT